MSRKAGTPGVGDISDFDDGGSDTEPLAWRQVFGTEIKVDEEVVASERPALSLLRNKRNAARVHDADLNIWMRFSFLSGHPATFGPVIAMGSAFQADLAAL